MEKEKFPPVSIVVGVYWYEDDDGSIVFDEEEMLREYEDKVNELKKELKKK